MATNVMSEFIESFNSFFFFNIALYVSLGHGQIIQHFLANSSSSSTRRNSQRHKAKKQQQKIYGCLSDSDLTLG